MKKVDSESLFVCFFGGVKGSSATYTDEVVLWEATCSDVVLQQLLGEVLVHLRCFVGIHCVSQGLV